MDNVILHVIIIYVIYLIEPTESFALKLKHLIKFGEYKDNMWTFRFASHPRFSYWAFNMLYRRRLLSQGNVFIKQNPEEALLSHEQILTSLTQGSYSPLMNKLMHYAKNVTGTNSYWNKTKNELKAIIAQKGAPTIFWTLSCAEFHWPEFHSLFDDSNTQLREHVLNNPHILDWLFTIRVEHFVKKWLYDSLGASWHWYRYEFALQRGSIHCHGVAKLKDDPGLCELSKIALKGYLTKQELINGVENASTEYASEMYENVAKGSIAEKSICDYVDTLISTMNPYSPEDGWVKPDRHPCKEKFCDMFGGKYLDQDYINLLNSVQRHSICSSLYCLRQNSNRLQYCRFEYPIEKTQSTHLVYEKVNTKNATRHYRVKILTARNDSRLNRHQRLQLQGWRANCDINVIMDYHACVEYLTKYASKAEKMSTVAKDTLISVLTKNTFSVQYSKSFKTVTVEGCWPKRYECARSHASNSTIKTTFFFI